jgi:SpoVK/Ycf46/Vps4 family AAA+-type ATPase
LTYDQLTNKLAIDCDGFSGAAIAGVARAAASRALARAVGRLSGDAEHLAEDDEEAPSSMMDCLVTQDDFYRAVHDIRDSMGTGDQAEAEVVDDEIDRRRVGFRSRLRHRLRTWILTE